MLSSKQDGFECQKHDRDPKIKNVNPPKLGMDSGPILPTSYPISASEHTPYVFRFEGFFGDIFWWEQFFLNKNFGLL